MATRVIAESADFVALAPYAPRFPFETWLCRSATGRDSRTRRPASSRALRGC